MALLAQPLQSLLLAGLLATEPTIKYPVSPPQPQPSRKLPCQAGTFVKDELYFGLSKPDGKTVAASEWQQFINRVVTPRFREGLTVIPTYGQYLDRTGKLTVEPSKLLILIYTSGGEKERAIVEIISIYKQTFQQESVLRLTTCAQATF